MLLGALLRLRFLALCARRLGGGCGAKLIEPRLQKRRSRLGDAQGAVSVDAFLDVIAAEFLALPSEAVLIADDVRGPRAVFGAVLDDVQNSAHRPFRFGALLDDLGGVADERRALGPPKSAGSGLAIGGLEHA